MATRADNPFPLRHPALACWLVGLGLGLGPPVSAQPQPPVGVTETITVTGTRVPGARLQPGSVTPIDALTIERRNDSNVFELLRDVPGVYVSLPGGRGSLGSVFIRGSEPNYAAVLVDGIQVNDPTNTRGGSFDFSTLDIDSIERIEILRAPQSSIYGSDALSGAINVITLSGSEAFTAGGNLELGAGEYARGGVRLSGPAPRGGLYSVRLSAITEGDGADPAEFDGHAFTGKFTSDPHDPFNFSVYARSSSANAVAFPDDSGGARLAVLRDKGRRETDAGSLGFDARAALSARTTLHVAASVFGHDERASSPAVPPGVRPGIPGNSSDAQFARNAVNVFLTSTASDALQAAYGLAYQAEDGKGLGLISLGPQSVLPRRYRLERDNLGVYGEIDYALAPRWSVDAALRVDRTDGAGTVRTGKIALAYDLPGRPARLHLTWGEGFKLPSLFALGDPLVGNPALNAETATSWELGLHATPMAGRLRWQLAIFDQRFSNLIDFDGASFMMVNRSRVDIAGVEASADYRAGERWRFLAHATRVTIDVLDPGVRLRHRPERTGGLGIEWTPSDAWTAYLGVHLVGARFDSSVPTGEVTLPGYRSVDLTLNHALGRHLSLSLSVDNLTDAYFEPAIGFPDLGRRLRFSVRGAFERAGGD